jgi:signal transduction histidine kinase
LLTVTDTSELDLLARMSHEMRTPLSAILGFAQLMESGTPSPTVAQKRSIDLILQAGWHLEKLINTTRDLALLESGTLSLSLDAVPLGAVMRDCETVIEPQAEIHGVRVIFPVFETPCFVWADGIRLQQVLGHLLSAAIEYSAVDAAVVVDCELRGSEWIRIGINEGGDELSAGRATRIFPARDLLEITAPAMDGAGICLLLAKRFVELMGGAIGAESTVGTGRIFSFDLKRMIVPLAVSTTSAASAFEPAAITSGGQAQGTLHSPGSHAH